jgi:hypothetical protein
MHRDERAAMPDFQIPDYSRPIGISDAFIAVLARRANRSFESERGSDA